MKGVEKSDKRRALGSVSEDTAFLMSHTCLDDHLLAGSGDVSSDNKSFPLTSVEGDEDDVIGSDADVSDTFSSDDDSDSVDASNSSKTSKRKDKEVFNYNKKRILSIIKEVAMSNASEELEEEPEDHDNESYLSYDISAEFSEEETIEMIL